MRFHTSPLIVLKHWTNELFRDGDPRPDFETYTEAILATPFPGAASMIDAPPFLVAKPGDTLDSLAALLAAWEPSEKGDKAEAFWRDELRRLNPHLGQTALTAGTHVHYQDRFDFATLKAAMGRVRLRLSNVLQETFERSAATLHQNYATKDGNLLIFVMVYDSPARAAEQFRQEMEGQPGKPENRQGITVVRQSATGVYESLRFQIGSYKFDLIGSSEALNNTGFSVLAADQALRQRPTKEIPR